MLETLSNQQLSLLYQQLDLTRRQYRLLQRAPRNKRRERGAYVAPALKEDEADLEKRLLKSFRQLGRDWLASLAGASDDIASGRLLQAKKKLPPNRQEELDALSYFDVDEAEADKPVDKSRLAALLALLLLWKNRHLGISDSAIERLFGKGRTKALSDSKRPQAPEGADTAQLMHEILGKYEGDIQKLEEGLENGTARSYGIRWIIENAPTIGAAAVYVRRLLDAEAYRVEMFAESLTWRAWQAGKRAGAVDAAKATLKERGHPFAVEPEDLTEEDKEALIAWKWVGPQDHTTCDSCSSMFGGPVYAVSLAALPDPTEICEYGLSCRHDWQPA
jgi:hypothetical protein